MWVRRWVTRDLRRGDMSCLGAVANGSQNHDEDRLARLAHRRFVKRHAGQPASITALGRAALLVYRLINR